MSGTDVNYHGRIDFRALDVIVDALDNATPAQLQEAVKTCKEMSKDNLYMPRTKKRIWADLANLIARTLK